MVATAAVMAEVGAGHARLMEMTVAKISDEFSAPGFDKLTLGHVAIRCSIISATMSEMITVAVPKDAPDDHVQKMQSFKAEYSTRSEEFLSHAVGYLELPPADFDALYTDMFNVWARALTQAAAQLFKKNPEDSEASRIGRAFKDDLDICNYLAQQANLK